MCQLFLSINCHNFQAVNVTAMSLQGTFCNSDLMAMNLRFSTFQAQWPRLGSLKKTWVVGSQWWKKKNVFHGVKGVALGGSPLRFPWSNANCEVWETPSQKNEKQSKNTSLQLAPKYNTWQEIGPSAQNDSVQNITTLAQQHWRWCEFQVTNFPAVWVPKKVAAVSCSLKWWAPMKRNTIATRINIHDSYKKKRPGFYVSVSSFLNVGRGTLNAAPQWSSTFGSTFQGWERCACSVTLHQKWHAVCMVLRLLRPQKKRAIFKGIHIFSRVSFLLSMLQYMEHYP